MNGPGSISSPVDANGWETTGLSVQGRPIRVRSFGHGPRRVLFIGGIHGDEAEGTFSTAQLPEAFAIAGLDDAVTLTILEDANPDGRAAGTRTNANGVDINRNFPAKNFDTSNPAYGLSPLSQPESRAVYETIERVRPDLVVAMHSWAGRQFLNYDGPARGLAEQFSTLSGLEVEESTSFAPTPGSLGSYVGRDRGIPILTIEVLKGSSPEAVWGKVREALLRVIAG
ncbi:zinc carboxypeptidase [Mycobacterium sp. BK086]|nr:M14 family zinc carboxypeptidase [Mycobacterium sp. BK086]TDO10476.1 zinc carboxypeptidase [Mycobacterium sp. BK086]